MKLSRKQFDERWAMQRHPQFKVHDKVVYYVVDLDSYEIQTLKDVHIINGEIVWTYESKIIENDNNALDTFLEMQKDNLVYYYDKDIEVFYKQELKGLNENLALIAAKNEISDIYSNENLVNEFIKVLDMDNLDLINDKQALLEMVNNKNEMIYNLIQMVIELQKNL